MKKITEQMTEEKLRSIDRKLSNSSDPLYFELWNIIRSGEENAWDTVARTDPRLVEIWICSVEGLLCNAPSDVQKLAKSLGIDF